jgi:hypothetical protein
VEIRHHHRWGDFSQTGQGLTTIVNDLGLKAGDLQSAGKEA